jgi:hypothetical protein
MSHRAVLSGHDVAHPVPNRGPCFAASSFAHWLSSKALCNSVHRKTLSNEF